LKEDLSFLSQEEEEVSEDSLKEISELTHVLVDLRKDINQAEDQLKELKENERVLSREDIPNLILAIGITSITLDTGEKVSIEEDLYVVLPKKDFTKRNESLKWIAKNGGGGLIKEEVVVEDPENNLLKFLIKEDIPFDKNKGIHPATLKSFIKSKLGITKGSLQEVELSDIPKELNVFMFKKTKINQP